VRTFLADVLWSTVNTAWIGTFFTLMGVIIESEAKVALVAIAVGITRGTSFGAFDTFSIVQGPAIETVSAGIGVTARSTEWWAACAFLLAVVPPVALETGWAALAVGARNTVDWAGCALAVFEEEALETLGALEAGVALETVITTAWAFVIDKSPFSSASCAGCCVFVTVGTLGGRTLLAATISIGTPASTTAWAVLSFIAPETATNVTFDEFVGVGWEEPAVGRLCAVPILWTGTGVTVLSARFTVGSVLEVEPEVDVLAGCAPDLAGFWIPSAASTVCWASLAGWTVPVLSDFAGLPGLRSYERDDQGGYYEER
jgi:hypothetical protein